MANELSPTVGSGAGSDGSASNVSAFVESIAWNVDGLAPAVAISQSTGEPLMLAWMNRASLKQTLERRLACFWSRSRQTLWQKGETSGNTLSVRGVRTDCDRDAIVIIVEAAGPACHTGTRSCFFRNANGSQDEGPGHLSEHAVDTLARTIAERVGDDPSTSYTAKLLDRGVQKINGKIEEESGELTAALESESDERVASEAADLIYHVLVGLRARDIDASAVWAELDRRRGVSGLAEKANRGNVS